MQLVFVTVLVATTYLPGTGWMQYTQSYSDQRVCEDVIRTDYEQIAAALKYRVGSKFRKVIEMRCVSYEEAVRLNAELGH